MELKLYKRKIIIALVILILVSGLGVGGYFLIKKPFKADTTQSTVKNTVQINSGDNTLVTGESTFQIDQGI